MADKNKVLDPQRVWIRSPLRNNNSLSMNIPAGIRRALALHQNATLLVTLVDNHMEVRKMTDLPTTDDKLPRVTLASRRKSWKRSPIEKPPVKGGYLVQQPDPKDS